MHLESVFDQGDYHVHSIFSDGAETYSEIARTAGLLELEVVAVCDHSDAYMAMYGFPRLGGWKHALHRWRNIVNEVQVIRGIELDLLSPRGDVSDVNLPDRPGFVILSLHRRVYDGPDDSVTEAYLHAIDRYADQIDLIGHPCATYFGEGWDEGIAIEKIVQYANDAGIGIEINGANLLNERTNLDKLEYVCRNARRLYANSDAHTAYEMVAGREAALAIARSFGRLRSGE